MKQFTVFLTILSCLVLYVTFYPPIVFSHTIELITGESIEGDFIKGDNQAVTIKTGNGEKEIPINSITRIVFKKDTEKGTLKGVITYYFNDNIGDKPDVGSQVYVMRIKRNWGKETKSFLSNPEVEDFVNGLWTYTSANTTRSITKSSSGRRSLLPGESAFISKMTEELREMGADTEEGFKRIDEKAFKILNDIKIFEKIQPYHAVVDGDGQFELQLPPGSYFVVVLSNHRKGHDTQTERFHNSLYVAFQDIREREVTTITNSFSPY